MYDYRTDIINLMRSTQDDERSLKQSMIAMKLIVKMFENSVTSDEVKREEKQEQDEKLEKLLSHNSQKKSKKVKKPKNVKKEEVKLKKEHPKKELEALYVPQIDFDLKKQTVAIVCAQDSVARDAKMVVVSHNGEPTAITNEDKKTIKKAVSGVDIVIVIKNDVSRGILDTLNEEEEKTFKYAISNTTSQVDIEKALYRSHSQLGILDDNALKYPSANLKSLLLASKTQIK